MSMFAHSSLGAATIAEVVAKIKPLKPQEKLNYLVQGARAEGELVYYGTLPIDEFLPLARVFNARYRSLALQHYFSPRDGILSRSPDFRCINRLTRRDDRAQQSQRSCNG